MKQEKWFDRQFHFDSTATIFPSIVERLTGTPARLEEKLAGVATDLLTLRFGDSWTIKENIGHLADLEPLWQGRLSDILEGAAELRTTDLMNRKTTEANHNARSTADLLLNFRSLRLNTMKMIGQLTDEDLIRSALHPRLKTPMRIIDHFLFVAEHDDHHLARITELVKIFGPGDIT